MDERNVSAAMERASSSTLKYAPNLVWSQTNGLLGIADPLEMNTMGLFGRKKKVEEKSCGSAKAGDKSCGSMGDKSCGSAKAGDKSCGSMAGKSCGSMGDKSCGSAKAPAAPAAKPAAKAPAKPAAPKKK
jgi:hypothetical protein